MKQDEQETNDLKRMAPTLATMPKDNPFRVPDGYFDMLESDVIKEFQEHSQVLEKKESLAGYAVPPGYFNELPLIINDRITKKKSSRILSLLPRPAFALTMAAAFLAMLLITRPALWFRAGPQPDTLAVTVDELGNSTYLAELDEHVLVEALGDYETSDASERNADSEVEKYLLDNHIDLNQLISE